MWLINIPGGIKGEVQQYCVAKGKGKNRHCFFQVLEIGRNLLSGSIVRFLNWVGGRGRKRYMIKGNLVCKIF